MVRDCTTNTTTGRPLKIDHVTTTENAISKSSLILAIAIPFGFFILGLIGLGVLYVYMKKSKHKKRKLEKSPRDVKILCGSTKVSKGLSETQSRQVIINVHGAPKRDGKFFTGTVAEFRKYVPQKKTSMQIRLVPSGLARSKMDREKSLLDSKISCGIAYSENFEQRKNYETTNFKKAAKNDGPVKACKALHYEIQRKFLQQKGRDIEDIVRIQAGTGKTEKSGLLYVQDRTDVSLTNEKLAVVQESKFMPSKNVSNYDGYERISIKNTK